MNCWTESIDNNESIDRENRVADTMNTEVVADDLERLGSGGEGAKPDGQESRKGIRVGRPILDNDINALLLPIHWCFPFTGAAHWTVWKSASVSAVLLLLFWGGWWMGTVWPSTVYRTVSSIFLYACESWTLTAELQRRIQAIEMRCYRKILRISYKDHVTNEKVRVKIQQAIEPHEDLIIVKRRRL